MILYFQSRAYPGRTFTAVLEPHYTIARVRAHILHMMYDIGDEKHQFRLRFDGQYLKDSLTLADYKIMSSAVVSLVPLSGGHNQSDADLRSSSSNAGEPYSMQQAVLKEVSTLNRRESTLQILQGIVHLFLIGSLLGLVSMHWYSFFWLFSYYLSASILCPNFTRQMGFTGSHALSPKMFCKVFGIVTLVIGAVSVYLSVRECSLLLVAANFSYHRCYTAAVFIAAAVVVAASEITIWTLLYNLKFEIGDTIEIFLCQTRSLEVILNCAVYGKVAEKRLAAFDLATLAASSDDHKFLIAAEGGLDTLMGLSMSTDPATQEFAVEALAEMLTVPAIQDSFVRSGNLHTLTSLLHSSNPSVVREVAAATSYIVADSEDNRHSVVEEQGWTDLVHAAHNSNEAVQKVVAGIFLDLAFNRDIKLQMTSMNTPAQALVRLARCADIETKLLALQTLELLAISSPDFICSQSELLDLMLELPYKTTEERILLISSKILLYFAENREACEDMLKKPNLGDVLAIFARSANTQVQKIVAKIAYCAVEPMELRDRARAVKLEEILVTIRDRATDRELWNMADQGLLLLLPSSEDGATPLSAALNFEGTQRAAPHDFLVSSSQRSLLASSEM